MTIREVLKKHRQIDETELFLSHLLKMSKAQLIANSTKALTKPQIHKLEQMLKLFNKGMPAAYILGYKYFYGLKFKVNRSVLIPRPESEWLVDKTLSSINTLLTKNSNKPINILEIGTGSGCIAIALAKQLPANGSAKITASDISDTALTVAKINAKTHKAKIKFVKSNLLSNLQGQFDLIIANLPYVPLRDYQKLYKNLRFEPKLALTDGTNDSTLYIKLLDKLEQRKSLPNFLLFEIDPTTKPLLTKKIKQLALTSPRTRVRFYTDIHKLPRYSVVTFENKKA